MPTPTAPCCTPPEPIRKTYTPDEINFTPGSREFTAWISTETVDHEGDVVVAAGVDFSSVFLGTAKAPGNPVVLAIHDAGKWPLGKCAWVKLRKTPEWVGLYAKTILDPDPDTETVWLKIRAGSVRGISIRFKAPDDFRRGEWGPPTAAELRANPHWAGANRIIRRCVLLEYSVCPIPICPTALIDSVNKGLARPTYLSLESTMAEQDKDPRDPLDPSGGDPPPGTTTKGKGKGKPGTGRDTDTDTDEEMDEGEDPNLDEDEDEDEDEEEEPIRKGDHVKFRAPHAKGVGKVVSVHRDEMVPDVEDDIHGTADEPAAKVRCYKRMGDGHVPTSIHKGVLVKHCERIDEMKAPTVKKGVNHHAAADIDLDPSEIRPIPDPMVERRAHFKAALHDPGFLRSVVQETLDQIQGTVR